MLVLLVLSVLPIAFLQTRILFNSVYASALDTMAARRHLVLFVYSQLNLRGLLRLLPFCARRRVLRLVPGSGCARRHRLLGARGAGAGRD